MIHKPHHSLTVPKPFSNFARDKPSKIKTFELLQILCLASINCCSWIFCNTANFMIHVRTYRLERDEKLCFVVLTDGKGVLGSVEAG